MKKSSQSSILSLLMMKPMKNSPKNCGSQKQGRSLKEQILQVSKLTLAPSFDSCMDYQSKQDIPRALEDIEYPEDYLADKLKSRDEEVWPDENYRS